MMLSLADLRNQTEEILDCIKGEITQRIDKEKSHLLSIFCCNKIILYVRVPLYIVGHNGS